MSIVQSPKANVVLDRHHRPTLGLRTALRYAVKAAQETKAQNKVWAFVIPIIVGP
jgi:hypothetical protein